MYKTKENDEEMVKKLKFTLKSEKIALIYHCYNHYICPVGYEESPINPEDIFKKKEEI